MNDQTQNADAAVNHGLVAGVIRFCLHNKLVVVLVLALIVLWGWRVMPFRTTDALIPRDPIPVDAIPDIGENQQIIFTDWPGRSPQDVEDQITYPLTTTLQGTPGFKAIRGFSMFGFSVVYVIFDDTHDYYWCRSRVLEKLNTAQQKLPAGVTPSLGPDATALGQVFWYTLEGSQGGFDLMELRSVQDWYVRYALQAIPGVSEVASVGGYVREYQVDVDPDAMRAHNVRLQDVFMAVQRANVDVGAETIEFNGVEYLVRGRGFVRSAADIENIVIRSEAGVPLLLRSVARVQIGPALRRGMLDKEGVEAVGGVVVVRYGANPLEVTQRVKQHIAELSASLPKKTLESGGESQVQIVPFYDRSELIHETLDTLKDALIEQVLVTTFVVLLFLRHLRSCIVISLTLPLAVLVCFILMKLSGVDSNLMSLGGIAIAIGTLVDMGIILTENIVRHIEADGGRRPLRELIYDASREIGGAVTTAILMTVIAFLPVFALDGPEGKLFRPLAYTKTFALLGSLLVAILILPTLAQLVFRPLGDRRPRDDRLGDRPLAGLLLPRFAGEIASFAAMTAVLVVLTLCWMPLGPGHGLMRNLLIVLGINLAWGSVRVIFIDFYPYLLRVFLEHKIAFLSLPAGVVLLGATVWLGFGNVFGWLPQPAAPADSAAPPSAVQKSYRELYVRAVHAFPGLPREFMPFLDEGSYLYMPTLMPHAGIGASLEAISAQDRAIRAIPEVESVVGKLGRAETAIDPAPVNMVETIITYKPEFLSDESGTLHTFRFDAAKTGEFCDALGRSVPAPDGRPYVVRGLFPRDEQGRLIPDPRGRPFRNWRPPLDPELNPGRKAWGGIVAASSRRKGAAADPPETIWDNVAHAARYPGMTDAPLLQPISTRIVMLQSGIRAAMAVKIAGRNLEEIEQAGFAIAEQLKLAPGVAAELVVPDRVVGKPYVELDIDRDKIARYGVNIRDVQDVIEIALGGITATTTYEGRQRYPIRVRYARETRDSLEALERIRVPAAGKGQIPLAQLATIQYVRGPQEIKSEDNFLVSYVLFDKKPGFAEIDVIEQAGRFLDHKLASGELKLPAGVHYRFAGNYENNIRFQDKLRVILPLSLLLLFLLVYFQFRSVLVSLVVFTGIPVAWAGGFVGMWLIGQDWFFDFEVFGRNVRDLLHFQSYNLSAAVWVGFLALFSVSIDDGVVLAEYLGIEFRKRAISGVAEIRAAIISAGARRVRPCLMTSATTVLSLMPVLTSEGRGADVMIPIALPALGGLSIELLSLFVLPVCYCWMKEWQWRLQRLPEPRP
ncbi:Cation efflux system protein CusA [Phycisphaerae bacterium RAS1]|nr:Cation efflux system protein CusA [Phycisphaerae bacterium RAS1]